MNRLNTPTLDPEPTTEAEDSPESFSTRRGDTTAAVNAAAANRFRIPGDVIAKTCESLPDDQRHAIKWAAGYCRSRNLNCDEFGAMLTQPGSEEKSYHSDSVYAAFTGRRNEGGSLARFCEAVHVLRKRVEETSPRSATQFVETALSKAIFAACRHAFAKKRIVCIFGRSQIGKTRALEEYSRRHNHGETILVRMPTGGSIQHFISELAIRLGIGLGNSRVDLRRRIIESFDERTLLIVDECEQCTDGRQNLLALEFAREIVDRRKCGAVFCGAPDFRNALRTNHTLEKLWKRGIRPLHLPDHPSRAHLNQFAAAFGLDPATDANINVRGVQLFDQDGNEVSQTIRGNPIDLQTKVIKENGLGRWLAILEDAQDLAKEKHNPLKWAHVLAAHALFNQEP